ncbi:409_t:CDS:2 [Ambispora leptoticha]|uniref:Ubiquitin carboxyl-terminal hydrolase n=1 Tax=Ambispora leptoticha TaxID=144679 RepID=A0A9N8VF46_9GLOM|nr:409_t:CDS:2 [Ambispora leptoticha]
MAMAEAAKFHKDYDTIYTNYLKIASIILEIIPQHKDFQTFLKDPTYSTYEDLKKNKMPAVLDEAEKLTEYLTQRDRENDNDYSSPQSSSTRNNNKNDFNISAMPVPHPTAIQQQQQSNYQASNTLSSSNNNTEFGVTKSPVYIIGDHMIGSITTNESSAPLNPTIANRIANSISSSSQYASKPLSSSGISEPSASTMTTTSNSNNISKGPDPLAGFNLTQIIKATDLDKFLKSGVNVLILDVRERKQFEGGHIKTKNIVCLEPIILHDGISSIDLESRLIISPENERTLFDARHTFDLIVYHDQSSVDNPGITSKSNSRHPMRNLVDAIMINEYKKPLKRPPVILIGGLDGWRRLVGDAGIERGPGAIYPGIDNTAANSSTPPNGGGFREPLLQNDKSKRNGIVIPDANNWMESLGDSNHTDKRPPITNYMDLFMQPNDNQQSMQLPNYNTSKFNQAYPNYNNYPLTSSPIVQQQPNNYYISNLPTTSKAISKTPIPGQASDIGSSSQAQVPAQSQPQPAAPIPAAPIPAVIKTGSTTLQRRRTFIDHPFNSFTRVNNPDYKAPPRPQKPLPPPPSHQTNEFSSSQQQMVSMPPKNAEETDLDRRPSLRSGGSHQRFPNSESSFSQLGSGIGTTGLKNLGNTCFMNSVIQCLSGTIPFSRYFLNGSYKQHVNLINPLGTKGQLAEAFAKLIRYMWSGQYTFVSPVTFKEAIGRFAPQFSGSDQQDSQEFLAYLLDGLHEDLNIIKYKPPMRELTEKEEEERELLPSQKVSEIAWEEYTRRNCSMVVSLFQGQYRSRLQCLTCGKTSTKYDAFMCLQVPIPAKSYEKINLHHCLNEFVKEEILEGKDAWHCPRCRVPRRATKSLILSRLPNILLIHLKRFSYDGPFRNKLETVVDFPLVNLDLTEYMLPPLPPTAEIGLKLQTGLDNTPSPRQSSQPCGPPYIYDLYAVSNHYGGGLNGGHYTACVRNGYRQEWHNFDDSRVSVCDESSVM